MLSVIGSLCELSNPPTTARRECCLCSAPLLLSSAAQLSCSAAYMLYLLLLGAKDPDPTDDRPRRSSGTLVFTRDFAIPGPRRASDFGNLPKVWFWVPWPLIINTQHRNMEYSTNTEYTAVSHTRHASVGSADYHKLSLNNHN